MAWTRVGGQEWMRSICGAGSVVFSDGLREMEQLRMTSKYWLEP